MTCPTGTAVTQLLPALQRALSGDGPAILPLSTTDPHSAQIETALAAGSELAPGEDDAADPTALVIATSGSTGTPKGVLLSAGQLAASATATEDRLGGPGQWLLALPAHHIAGMQVLLRSVRAGTEPLVLDTAQPFTAAAFAAAAHTMSGIRNYVSLVPTQLQRLIADKSAAAATAAIFDAVLIGGAASPPDLLAAARSAGINIVTSYGMSETCGGCIYDGRPLAGVTVSRTGEGALILDGPMVARGYRGRPHDPAFPRPGTFVTSDIGDVDADGRVTVLGRADDMIISGGENIAPARVEAALRQLANITDVAVIGVPDPRWGQAVAAVIVSDHSWTVPQLRAALDTVSDRGPVNVSRSHYPQFLVRTTTLPLLPSGKPDLAALRNLVQHYSR